MISLSEALQLFDYTRNLRRDFHMHPELGFQEVRTSGIIARELRELGLEVSTGIAKTGVVALIEGRDPGPVVLLRFDIDALPIHEQTGAEYASKTPGLMHACGHDAHAAIGLTVARLLHAHREEISGTVKLVFQPAEEGMGGAETMINEGVMEGPAPTYCLGMHIWNEETIGWVGVAGGPVMAGAGAFEVVIHGKGGHGANPHHSIDPVLASAQIISAAQSIVSRNVDPQKSAVVTFASIHGGEAFNVIPSHVKMTGTIRYFEPEIGRMVYERFEHLIKTMADGMGCQAEVTIHDLTPPVINDEKVAACIQDIAQELLPAYQLNTHGYTTMGAEDFALFTEKTPGAYFFFGSANPEKGLIYGHHHPKFDVDEDSLPGASALMANAALEVLRKAG